MPVLLSSKMNHQHSLSLIRKISPSIAFSKRFIFSEWGLKCRNKRKRGNFSQVPHKLKHIFLFKIMYIQNETALTAETALNIFLKNLRKVRLEHFCCLTGLLQSESPPIQFEETAFHLTTSSYILYDLPHCLIMFPSSYPIGLRVFVHGNDLLDCQSCFILIESIVSFFNRKQLATHSVNPCDIVYIVYITHWPLL